MPIIDPPIEIEFRDGLRVVPNHVASLITIAEIDPVEYTYEEAVTISNDAMLRRTLNDAMQAQIGSHFRENR